MAAGQAPTQAGNPIIRYLNVRRVPRIHPGLLALAALISTVAIYPPNARLYAAPLEDASRGQVFMLTAIATAAALGLVVASRAARHPERSGMGRGACLASASIRRSAWKRARSRASR